MKRVAIYFTTDNPEDFELYIDDKKEEDVKLIRLAAGKNLFTQCILTKFIRDEEGHLIGEVIHGEQHALEVTYDLFDYLEENTPPIQSIQEYYNKP